jgi:hypothetical protein
METQLDHTYLRPGIISRAAAVGLAAVGVGAGVLLGCWGLSFFWHVDNALVRRLEAIAKQTAGLSDVVRDEIGTLSLRTTESIDALGGKLDALEHRVDAINQRVTVTRSFQDGSGQPERTGTGDVIRREVTAFNTVSHEGGEVTTGWQYKDGASDGQPMRQYCYFSIGKNGVATRIELAFNGRRLFNENVTRVPRLEEALAKCQWWTS